MNASTRELCSSEDNAFLPDSCADVKYMRSQSQQSLSPARSWLTNLPVRLPSYQPARSLWSAGELYGPSRPSTMMSFTRFTGSYHQQFHCAVLNNLNSSWNGSRLVSVTRPFLCVIKIGLGCRPSRPCFTFCPPPTLLGRKPFSGLGAATTGWRREHLYFWCWPGTSETQEGGSENDVPTRNRSSNTGHSRSIKSHLLASRTTTLVSRP